MHTGGTTNLQRAAGFAAAVAIFKLAMGTGLLIDHAQLFRQLNVDNGNGRAPAYEGERRASIADAISQIRLGLNLTTSSLAKILKVSRQTVYNWIKGETLSEEHLAHLERLAKAASLMSAEKISIAGVTLKRRLFSGKTFHEALTVFDPAEVTQSMISILLRENQQRERMAHRRTGKATPLDIRRDFPISRD